MSNIRVVNFNISNLSSNVSRQNHIITKFKEIKENLKQFDNVYSAISGKVNSKDIYEDLLKNVKKYTNAKKNVRVSFNLDNYTYKIEESDKNLMRGGGGSFFNSLDSVFGNNNNSVSTLFEEKTTDGTDTLTVQANTQEQEETGSFFNNKGSVFGKNNNSVSTLFEEKTTDRTDETPVVTKQVVADQVLTDGNSIGYTSIGEEQANAQARANAQAQANAQVQAQANAEAQENAQANAQAQANVPADVQAQANSQSTGSVGLTGEGSDDEAQANSQSTGSLGLTVEDSDDEANSQSTASVGLTGEGSDDNAKENEEQSTASAGLTGKDSDDGAQIGGYLDEYSDTSSEDFNADSDSDYDSETSYTNNKTYILESDDDDEEFLINNNKNLKNKKYLNSLNVNELRGIMKNNNMKVSNNGSYYRKNDMIKLIQKNA